jgi:hypothetical protein
MAISWPDFIDLSRNQAGQELPRGKFRCIGAGGHKKILPANPAVSNKSRKKREEWAGEEKTIFVFDKSMSNPRRFLC